MRIAVRLIAIVGTALAGAGVLAAIGLAQISTDLLEDRKSKVADIVTLGQGLVGHYHAEAASGRMAEAEAQRQALAAMSALTYSADGYLWVHRLSDSVMLAHPNAALIGRSMASLRDGDEPLFARFNTVASANGTGFVFYHWPKPGWTEPVPKLSVVRLDGGWGWVIGSGLYLDDIDRLFRARAAAFGIAGAGVLLLTLAVAWWVGRSIVRPLGQVTEAIEQLAADQSSIHIVHAQRRDEIGRLARCLDRLRRHLDAARQAEALREAGLRERLARQQAVADLVHGFEAEAEQAVEELLAASRRMDGAAQAVSAAVAASGRQSAEAARAALDANAHVQGVAAATELLDAAEREISRQVRRSSEIGRQAREKAGATTAIVGGLEATAQRIGEIMRLIGAIAEQTNLLALNATIEAARAGEAGRGFAVVAGEVKTLARQSADATEEIGRHVEAIQAASRQVATAIHDVAATISAMDESSAAVAGAVDQQSSATSEISRNVHGAAARTSDVSRTMEALIRTAETTGGSATQAVDSARSVITESGRLRATIATFLAGIRDAEHRAVASLRT